MIIQKCATCGNNFRTFESWVKLNRKHCSWKCRDQYGNKNNSWVENDLSYKGVHRWLNRIFGKASVCENKDCEWKSDWFEWCLVKGKAYERKRENFIQLCRSCHKFYDMTDKMRENFRLGQKNRERNKVGRYI